jgi:hypothetical protein
VDAAQVGGVQFEHRDWVGCGLDLSSDLAAADRDRVDVAADRVVDCRLQ